MPILHIQVSAVGVGPNGQPVQIDPRQVLAMRGPVVQVSIRVPPEIAERLTAEGKPVPNPVNGFALIDSGAGSSCVDNAAAQTLGLPIVNVVPMASASHAMVEANVYPITFDILGNPPMTVNCPRATGATLANQGLVLLIGRDLLAMCHFTYNGTTGEFTLCF